MAQRLAAAIILSQACLGPMSVAAEQEAVNQMLFRGENWSIRQMASYATPASESYLILPVTRRASGKWEVGGSIKDDGYEQIYVDLVKRRIGPDASSKKRNGKTYTCKGSKKENKKKLASQNYYGACSSHFFTANGTEKVAQAVIACALLGCLGGYDSNWTPVFRPTRFKKALSSGLMKEVEEFVRRKHLTAIDEQLDLFSETTTNYLQELDQINASENDLEVLQRTKKHLVELESEYKSYIKDFEKAHLRIDYSRGFSPKKTSIDNRMESFLQVYGAAFSDSANLISELDSKIEALGRAKAAEQARLLAERRGIIDRIQRLLKENGYYVAKIDGSLGPETRTSIQSFFSDLDGQEISEDLEAMLSKIESALLAPAGNCSKSLDEVSYSACFTLDL